MKQAIFNDVVIATSDETVVIEGNHYFPLDAINTAYLRPNSKQTICGWKGTASYYDVVVSGKSAEAAAWTYQNPKAAAQEIQGYVAFWGDVKVK